MVRWFAVLVAALLALGAGNALAQAGYVHSMTGSATVRAGNEAPRPLRAGDIVNRGQTIATGPKSTAVVKFEDGQLVALAADSSFTVQEYTYNKQNISASRAAFNVIQGGLRFVTGMIGATNRNAVTMRAGTATIGIRGTDVFIHLDALTAAITLAVSQGAAVLNGVPVGVGQLATVTPGSPAAVVATASNIANTLNQALASLSMPANLPVNVAASAAAIVLAAAAAADPTNLALAAQAAAALQAAVQAAVEALESAIAAGGATPVLVDPPATEDTGTLPAPILTPPLPTSPN